MKAPAKEVKAFKMVKRAGGAAVKQNTATWLDASLQAHGTRASVEAIAKAIGCTISDVHVLVDGNAHLFGTNQNGTIYGHKELVSFMAQHPSKET